MFYSVLVYETSLNLPNLLNKNVYLWTFVSDTQTSPGVRITDRERERKLVKVKMLNENFKFLIWSEDDHEDDYLSSIMSKER